MQFIDQSCKNFVGLLASSSPVPGGGGACGLVAAVAVALGNMVASLTLGKPKYAQVQADMQDLQEKATKLQEYMLELVQKDAQAFEPLSRAYGLPSASQDEKDKKAAIMEQALKQACSTPLSLMQACCQGIGLHRQFLEKGTAIAVSDVGVGVAMSRAALLGASLNVFINTKAMQDKSYAGAINENANKMLGEYVPMADEIYAQVLARCQ